MATPPAELLLLARCQHNKRTHTYACVHLLLLKDRSSPPFELWSGHKIAPLKLGERRSRKAALSSPARCVSSARAAATATAVAGGLATVGRVPSWPQGGRAGTDGPDFRIVELAEMDVAT